MKKILTLAAAAALAVSLCSCAAGEAIKNAGDSLLDFFSAEEAESTEAPTETAPQEQVSNDINIGVYDFDTYDPLNTVSPTVKDVCGFIFEPLFSLDQEMRTVPVLAESCEKSSDGMTLTVRLKQNVLWHDGSAFGAADVVYTINRLKVGTANYGQLAEAISSAYAADANTVVIGFTRPVPDAASLLIFPIVKSGSEFSGSRDGTVIGTGPFYMAGLSGRDEYRLAVFEGYHGERAVLESVYVSFIPDKEKYISLFNANEINIATSETLDMTSFMPKGNASVQDFVSNDMTFLGFNTTDTMLADAKTRRAVSMLIDRDSIVTHIYFSRAAAADYAINPQSWLNFDTREKLRADAQGAAMLLREAGWKTDEDGMYYKDQGRRAVYFRVSILVNSDSPQRVETANNICERMRTAGISVSVEECGYEEYMSRIQSGDYQLFIGETELLPNNDLTPLAGSGGNYFGYANEEIDTLLTQMGTVTLESDIKAVSIALYEKLRDESPFAPICFSKKSIVSSAKIKYGVSPSISGYVRGTEKWGVQ